MRRFNIKMNGQIAAFAVAEKESYSAAGKSLQMTTSAVRKQIKSVGTEVGTPIFQRLGNRLEPTEVGNIYLPGSATKQRRRRTARFAHFDLSNSSRRSCNKD